MAETQGAESGDCWSGDGSRVQGGTLHNSLYLWVCLKRSIIITNKMEIQCEPDFQERAGR